ncbi:MAG: iron complex transport system substrate-binding protein [Actinomycetota bacterium]|nr:iron complex transport system substrate-binding protein [Actinomycetota bacterium]MDQ1667749.1 iron complex transport system substrate-binding protein [Actinomycetota bacterium]MDQ1669808.1 iron complex transport system substrate-binding protein [Actinomycetota bacterium]
MRIVSLLPSATEIVYTLGLEEQLAGVTFECDEPARARLDKTVVVGGLDTAGLTPGQVDALVRERVASGASLYVLDEDALHALSPDLVIGQDLCDVCALPAQEITSTLARRSAGARLLTLDPHRLDDVLRCIESVGAAAGVDDRAMALTSALRARLDRVGALVRGREQPRVAMLEWIDPPFAPGHWVPDLVTAAGGRSVLGSAGDRSMQIDWATVGSSAPDAIVVAPCGYRVADAAAQARSVLHHLPAGVPVWALDADGLVVRPGPRLVDGVEALAGVLHPDVVPVPASSAAVRLR